MLTYAHEWVTQEETYNSWSLSDEDSKNSDTIFTKFKEHIAPRKNSVFSRYVFQKRNQQQGETLEIFVTDLRNLVKDCSYDTPEEMVRDRIVGGIVSEDIREKLLLEGNELTMKKAIEISITHKTTKQI